MSEVPETISYASPHENRRASRLATIRVLSWAIGIVTLVVAVGGIGSVLNELSTVRAQQAAQRSEAYDEEFEMRHDDAIAMAGVLTIFAASALLLITGARAIPGSPRRGVTLLWIYVVVQLFGAFALGAVFMLTIYHSPAGMLFFIGAVPGLIACVFPIFLLFYLPAATG